ncbi:hypothetical protein Trydic_g5517 [Trypoxylus dichotomus]
MEKLQIIEKLEGDRNWPVWKFDVGLQLTVNKVMPVVKGNILAVKPLPEDAEREDIVKYEKETKQYTESDSLAQFIIGSSIKSEPKQHILTCKSSKEIWDMLHSIYGQKSGRWLDLLYCQLFRYEKDPNDDIATRVSKLQRIWQDLHEELKDEKVNLPQSMLVNRILNTLPNGHLKFKNAWESVLTSE